MGVSPSPRSRKSAGLRGEGQPPVPQDPTLASGLPSLACLPTPTQRRHTFQIWLHSMTSF